MKITHGILSGQVLQRLNSGFASVTISGTTETRKPSQVRVALFKGSQPLRGWKSRYVGTTTAGGTFRVTVDKIPTGGPYRLVIKAGAEAVSVRGLFVGDVWLLAGQSNMEGLGTIDDAAKPHPLARAFYMDRRWRTARDPLHATAASPDPVHHPGMEPMDPAAARKVIVSDGRGAGLGLPFAREMIRRTGVPQGLICTAHGGTSLLNWDPALRDRGGESFYGSMIRSVRANAQPLAGVLWYQGESDANPDCVRHYTKRMKTLVAAVRRDLRQPRLPWLMVQIARHLDPTRGDWNEIQEQQRELGKSVRDLGCVAAVDLPLDDGIHIAGTGHRRLGVRLARLADHMVHGNKQELSPPSLKKIGYRRGKYARQWVITATFGNVVGGLHSAGGDPAGFSVVNARNEPVPRIYRSWIEGDTVCLETNRPLDPAERLAYGYGRIPIVNVTDGRDMSIPVFTAQPIMEDMAITPWMNRWYVSEVIGARDALDRIPPPQKKEIGTTQRTFDSSGFVNMHESWRNTGGYCFFFGEIDCARAMKVEFRMGYDGPFRLWIDDTPFFTDMEGTNPCIQDAASKWVRLGKGRHWITIGMDTAGGRAWGFFLRFCLLNAARKNSRVSNDYVSPILQATADLKME